MSATPTDHDPVRLEPPTTYYEGVVRTPGFGEAPDRCRGLTPVGFCDHGHTVLGRSSCGTRYCPDHWRDWIEDAVISMVARLAAYREAVDGAEKPASHVVASPPQERRYSAREMWDTRSEAYDALEAAGVGGGPVVTHPYRTNERADNLFETAKASGDVDEETGRWAFLRDLADGWDDMSRYVEASPHYHVPIAPRRYVDGEAAPDGWIVKRLRKLRAFDCRDTESYRDMAASAYYVLTHGGVQDGRATTTYFGEVHPSTFDPAEELTAAKWSRIQMEAEAAVKEAPDEDEGGSGGGPDECPREECEAVVRDMMHLPEYLEDEEWVGSVLDRRGGGARVARLRGALAWWDKRTDRPPPHVRSDEERMRRWLKSRGQEYQASSRRRAGGQQVSLSTAVMS
jgi:hypothetical protein